MLKIIEINGDFDSVEFYQGTVMSESLNAEKLIKATISLAPDATRWQEEQRTFTGKAYSFYSLYNEGHKKMLGYMTTQVSSEPHFVAVTKEQYRKLENQTIFAVECRIVEE